MQQKTPFHIVLSRHITEKSRVLEQLQFNTSNPCVKKCTTPKYVFLVDKRANKQEIAAAVEEIYKVKVQDVNTVNVPGKLKRVRFKAGYSSDWKKAVVSLCEGQKIEVA